MMVKPLRPPMAGHNGSRLDRRALRRIPLSSSLPLLQDEAEGSPRLGLRDAGLSFRSLSSSGSDLGFLEDGGLGTPTLSEASLGCSEPGALSEPPSPVIGCSDCHTPDCRLYVIYNGPCLSEWPESEAQVPSLCGTPHCESQHTCDQRFPSRRTGSNRRL